MACPENVGAVVGVETPKKRHRGRSINPPHVLTIYCDKKRLSCAATCIFYLVFCCSENAGADVDAETKAPDQPAGCSGGQHGARLDGAQRRLQVDESADPRQVRLVTSPRLRHADRQN